MTSRTLCAYLEGTGLPVGAGLIRILRRAGIVLTLGTATALVLLACGAIGAGGWRQAAPMLLGLPGFAFTWWWTSRGARHRDPLEELGTSRVQLAVLGLFCGLVGLSLTAAVVRGSGDITWSLQPLLALVAALVAGVVPGLLITLAIAVTALVAAAFEGAGGLRAALVIAGVTLTGGLVGAFLHRLLVAVLSTLQQYRERFRDQRLALRNRERLLRHALRMGTVGDLAGMVVHQLRNQVQVMMGQVALAKGAADPQTAERLEQMAESMARARPLLDQLMNLAHPAEGEVKEHDLGVQLDAFVAQLRRTLPSALQLDVKRGRGGAFPARLEAIGLEHALWNLVINARQAMDGSGTLQLSVDGDEQAVWIAVTDTGPGIPEETLARIFEPYFTTKSAGNGTGLGLTAVARYVRAHRGEVVVRSQVGVGTRFELRFPRSVMDAGGKDEGRRLKDRSRRQAVG